MADTSVPLALRLKRPSWKDPRLVFGVLIVIGSLLLGGWVISRADVTIGVYAADQVLLPGEVITQSQVRVQQVNLGSLDTNYLLASEPWPTGLIAAHTIGDGDLIPQSAVAQTRSLDFRPMAISVPPAVAHGLNKGDRVELWFIPQSDRQAAKDQQEEPSRLVDEATISDISNTGGGLIGGGQVTVHLLVPKDAVAQVLGAQSSSGQVTVLAIPVELS